MDSTRYHKASIGEHALKPETLMLGYGYDPALSEGSVKPTVFLTSTFVFRTAEQGVDSGARCNGSMRTGFARLCQAL
jgi:methionine-gamma-lyase